MDTGKYKDKNGTTRVGDAIRFLAKQGKLFGSMLVILSLISVILKAGTSE